MDEANRLIFRVAEINTCPSTHDMKFRVVLFAKRMREPMEVIIPAQMILFYILHASAETGFRTLRTLDGPSPPLHAAPLEKARYRECGSNSF